MGTTLGLPGADPGFSQLPRPKVGDVAERSHANKVSYLWLGSRACLKALESFGVLMLKYAFFHILQTLFLSFLTYKVKLENVLI